MRVQVSTFPIRTLFYTESFPDAFRRRYVFLFQVHRNRPNRPRLRPWFPLQWPFLQWFLPNLCTTAWLSQHGSGESRTSFMKKPEAASTEALVSRHASSFGTSLPRSGASHWAQRSLLSFTRGPQMIWPLNGQCNIWISRGRWGH